LNTSSDLRRFSTTPPGAKALHDKEAIGTAEAVPYIDWLVTTQILEGPPRLSIIPKGYFLHIARAASNTAFSVGIVASSSGGENGIGTCIAAMRFTGASKS
jgi:hypothetical protein